MKKVIVFFNFVVCKGKVRILFEKNVVLILYLFGMDVIIVKIDYEG